MNKSITTRLSQRMAAATWAIFAVGIIGLVPWRLDAQGPDAPPVAQVQFANAGDALHFQLAQARNEMLKAGNAVASGELALLRASESQKSQPSKQAQAAGALGETGPAAAKAIPALIETLRHDGGYTTRGHAADALGSIDADGRIAVPALIEALHDQNTRVRRRAAGGLGKIGPNAKPALPALRIATKDEEMALRIEAAEALWKVGRDGNTAVPVLMEGLKDGKYPGLAARAVQTIGPAAETATPALIALLGDENGEVVRGYAVAALGSIGPGAAAAVPALVETLRRKDGYRPVAVDAAEALWNINRDPRAIPALIELLAADDCTVLAAEALGRIGPAAREAPPALRELTKSRDPDIRQAATEALRRVSVNSLPKKAG